MVRITLLLVSRRERYFVTELLMIKFRFNHLINQHILTRTINLQLEAKVDCSSVCIMYIQVDNQQPSLMLSHPSVGQFNLCLLLPSTHVLYPYSVTELINIHFGNNSNTSQHILNVHKSFTMMGVEIYEIHENNIFRVIV